MASSAVRVHAQTGPGRGRGRGVSPTRNTSFLSPPAAFRNPPPILRNTASPSPPPRNPPPGLRNTSSPSSSPSPPRNSPPRNTLLVSRNTFLIPRPLLQNINSKNYYFIT